MLGVFTTRGEILHSAAAFLVVAASGVQTIYNTRSAGIFFGARSRFSSYISSTQGSFVRNQSRTRHLWGVVPIAITWPVT